MTASHTTAMHSYNNAYTSKLFRLLANGNNVSFSHDDIFDPWYLLGDGNMRDVVHMGLHVCQMMGYEEILNSYKLITHNAARTLNISDDYGISVRNSANFLIFDANNFYNALNKKSEILYQYRNGQLLTKSIPSQREIFI